MDAAIFWPAVWLAAGVAQLAIVLALDWYDGDTLYWRDVPLVLLFTVIWPVMSCIIIGRVFSGLADRPLIRGRKP